MVPKDNLELFERVTFAVAFPVCGASDGRLAAAVAPALVPSMAPLISLR